MDAQRTRTAAPALRRGGFARDNRSGQIVKIKEWGGTDSLVAPAYKSDRYWVDRRHLTAVEDPHAWTGWTLVRLVMALVAALVASASMFVGLRNHGYAVADALVLSFPLWVCSLAAFTHVFRVVRD